ncbi:MAG: ATP-binding protein [Euryarchaeota archaeon]|nr:ATP-binding protein [Euryarchaeota archaeon]
MQEQLGVIYGHVDAAEFKIALNDAQVKRGEYVKVRHDEGIVLARIHAITRESDLSFERASSVSPFSRPDVSDKLSANAIVLGYRDARSILRSPHSPFKAGERVLRADADLIRSVLGLADDDGAYIGFLAGHDIPVRLDINALVQKHVCVLAKTGAGKSYVVGVILEELLKKQVPIVVIDPHGEYSSLAEPNVERREMTIMRRFGVKPKGYSEAVIEYSPDNAVNANAQKLKLDGTNLRPHEFNDILGGRISSVQMGMLHQAIKAITDRGKDYTVRDVIEEVKRNQSNAKWNLVSTLELVEGLGIFHEEGTPVAALAKKGQCTVVNLRGVPPEIQQMVVSRLGKELFEARKLNRIPPMMLVVEEAHNFCPERGYGVALSSDLLRTVAAEGRKFGLGLTVVSQRPAKVDKNVVSQCNTQFILKVTNPNDLKAISSSVEGLTGEMEGEIAKLPVGVAIVSNAALAQPIFVEIRPRETKHGGSSVNVLEDLDSEAPEEEREVETPVSRRAIHEELEAADTEPASPPVTTDRDFLEVREATMRLAESDLSRLPERNLDELLTLIDAKLFPKIERLLRDYKDDEGTKDLKRSLESVRVKVKSQLRKGKGFHARLWNR